MLTDKALTALRMYLKESLSSVKFKLNNTWHTSTIENAVILADGRVAVSFVMDWAAGNGTVTEVQLLNRAGEVWVAKETSIARNDPAEGILYQFRFSIVEE